MGRGTVAGWVGAVAGMLVLSGCAGIPDLAPRARDEAVPVGELTCEDLFSEGAAVAGTIPEGFDTVAVHRCSPFASRELADGAVWSGTLVERFEGDLGPFLAAIGAPSDAPWPGPCTADMVIAPDLWASDAAGRFVRLSYPATGCNKPKTEPVDAALADLELADETFTPGSIITTPEAAAAGCETRASVMVLNLIAPGVETLQTAPSDGAGGDGIVAIPYVAPSLPAAADVEGMRVCVYASDTSEGGGVRLVGDEGLFEAVHHLDAADAAAALAEVAGAPEVSAHCPDTASRFVVAQPLGARSGSEGVTVELDGCRRVIDPAFRTVAASGALISLLIPG